MQVASGPSHFWRPMKLIEKLAKEEFSKNEESQIDRTSESLFIEAFEAGFRKAREMCLELLKNPPYSYGYDGENEIREFDESLFQMSVEGLGEQEVKE